MKPSVTSRRPLLGATKSGQDTAVKGKRRKKIVKHLVARLKSYITGDNKGLKVPLLAIESLSYKSIERERERSFDKDYEFTTMENCLI